MHQNIAAYLAADALDVVRHLLREEPTFQDKCSARWRSRGSFVLAIKGKKTGLWFDHESGEGGDVIALIARERGTDRQRAYDIAKTEFGHTAKSMPFAGKACRTQPARNQDNSVFALRMWAEGRPIIGTAAEQYLNSRSLCVADLDGRHVLRWHSEARAMLALMTDPVTGEPCGVHRTLLDVEARKIDRRMLGRQGVIRLSPDEAVGAGLGVCEGVEDALAIHVSGWRPIWAATSAGAIARFPIIPGIESLSIFADADEVGRKAARSCASRWWQAGHEVRIVSFGGVGNE